MDMGFSLVPAPASSVKVMGLSLVPKPVVGGIALVVVDFRMGWISWDASDYISKEHQFLKRYIPPGYHLSQASERRWLHSHTYFRSGPI